MINAFKEIRSRSCSTKRGLYFMIVPFITNGWTLGKKIVRIRLVEQDRERISLKALIIRYGYLYFLFYGLSWLGQLLQQIMYMCD